MSYETVPTSYDTDAIEELLNSAREVMDAEYALSEPAPTPEMPETPDREQADKDQYDWREAQFYPNPDGLSLGEVVGVMRAERAAREQKVLQEPYEPHVVRPGAVEEKIASLESRGLI